MLSLPEALERFNRKERNLLVRDILGHEDAALPLSAPFREKIEARLGIRSLSLPGGQLIIT